MPFLRVGNSNVDFDKVRHNGFLEAIQKSLETRQEIIVRGVMRVCDIASLQENVQPTSYIAAE